MLSRSRPLLQSVFPLKFIITNFTSQIYIERKTLNFANYINSWLKKRRMFVFLYLLGKTLDQAMESRYAWTFNLFSNLTSSCSNYIWFFPELNNISKLEQLSPICIHRYIASHLVKIIRITSNVSGAAIWNPFCTITNRKMWACPVFLIFIYTLSHMSKWMLINRVINWFITWISMSVVVPSIKGSMCSTLNLVEQIKSDCIGNFFSFWKYSFIYKNKKTVCPRTVMRKIYKFIPGTRK